MKKLLLTTSILPLLYASLFFSGVDPKKQRQIPYREIHSLISDSFSIDQVSSKSELARLQLLPDRSLLGFDEMYRELRRYRYNATRRTYEVYLKQYIPYHIYTRALYISPGGNINIISGEDSLYTYDKDLALQQKKLITITHSGMQNGFYPASDNQHPVWQKGDDVVTTYYYADMADYARYFTEPQFIRFSAAGSGNITARPMVAKPAGLSRYHLAFPAFCYKNNTAYTIAPCYDTVYIHDMNTGADRKQYIGNAFYSKPHPFDNTLIGTEAFNAAHMKSYVSNFRYDGIYYNAHTGHFLLVFLKPLPERKDRMNTPDDQVLYGLVLDDRLNQLYYTMFPDNYYAPSCMINIANKGFAIPYIIHPGQKNRHEKDIRYHVFDF